jgi:hypothetical protein
MRVLVLFCALAMPAIAWLSRTGVLGPEPGALSNRYPTLISAAGYAFAIWGLIYLLNLGFAAWQLRPAQRHNATLARIRPATAAGFALTAAWLPAFAQQMFWMALAVIWASLACLLYAATVLARERMSTPGQRLWAWLPLSLHAGWLALAAFLNLAQVIAAQGLLPPAAMVAGSAALFALAASLLLAANWRMRGNWAFVAAAAWGLVAVYVQQSENAVPGSDAAAAIALATAALLVLQTGWLTWGRQQR